MFLMVGGKGGDGGEAADRGEGANAELHHERYGREKMRGPEGGANGNAWGVGWPRSCRLGNVSGRYSYS